MARYYLDTSAMIKRYHVEVGTPVMDRLLSESDDAFYLSRLATVEFQSAFARQVRMRIITEADFRQAHRRFLADIASPQYHVVRLLGRHFQIAEKLVHQHSVTRNLRTLDAIHLAIALDIRLPQDIGYFVYADANLCEVAELEGFTVINPVIA